MNPNFIEPIIEIVSFESLDNVGAGGSAEITSQNIPGGEGDLEIPSVDVDFDI